MELPELKRAAKSREYEDGHDLDKLNGIVDRKFLFMDMYDRGYISEDPTGERKRPLLARNVLKSAEVSVEYVAKNATLDAIRCNGVAVAYQLSHGSSWWAVRTLDTISEVRDLVEWLRGLPRGFIVAISDVMEIELGAEFAADVDLDASRLFDQETSRAAFVFGWGSPRSAGR